MSIADTVAQNYHKVKKMIQKADQKNIDLLAFPEMTLTGFNPDLLGQKWISNKIENHLDKIKQEVIEKEISIIVGHPEFTRDDRAFNAASVLIPGQKRKTYFKNNLTQKEKPHFEPGHKKLTFTVSDHKFGIVICRDQNDFELISNIKKTGIEALFILSAHFYDPKTARWKLDKNKAIPITRAVENKMYVFKANTVGTHISRISLGHSIIVDNDGAVINTADECCEVILSYEI